MFSALAFAGMGPIAWGVIIVGASLWLIGRPTLLQVVALGVLLTVMALGTYRDETIWSPYYRLRLEHARGSALVAANGVPHQAAIPTPGTDYEIPYERNTGDPADVLVVGAGNGNDVSVALRQGASRVDAVEIDPKLLEIGRALPSGTAVRGPSGSARSSTTARRSWRARTTATISSSSRCPTRSRSLSGQSAARLESYLFTREAFEAAADHLQPHGVFTIYNFYRERWLADRLAGTLTEVFGTARASTSARTRAVGRSGN